MHLLSLGRIPPLGKCISKCLIRSYRLILLICIALHSNRNSFMWQANLPNLRSFSLAAKFQKEKILFTVYWIHIIDEEFQKLDYIFPFFWTVQNVCMKYNNFSSKVYHLKRTIGMFLVFFAITGKLLLNIFFNKSFWKWNNRWWNGIAMWFLAAKTNTRKSLIECNSLRMLGS